MHNSFDDVLRSYFCQLFILLLIQLSDTSCNWRSKSSTKSIILLMHNSFDDVLRSYFCQLFILLLIQLSDTSCNWRSGRLASSNNHQLGVFLET